MIVLDVRAPCLFKDLGISDDAFIILWAVLLRPRLQGNNRNILGKPRLLEMQGKTETSDTLVFDHTFGEHRLCAWRKAKGEVSVARDDCGLRTGGAVSRRGQVVDLNDLIEKGFRNPLDALQEIPLVGIRPKAVIWIYEYRSVLGDKAAEQRRVDEVAVADTAIEPVLLGEDLRGRLADIVEDRLDEKPRLDGRDAGQLRKYPGVPTLTLRPFDVGLDAVLVGLADEFQWWEGILLVEVRRHSTGLAIYQEINPVWLTALEVAKDDLMVDRLFYLANLVGQGVIGAVDIRQAGKTRPKDFYFLLRSSSRRCPRQCHVVTKMVGKGFTLVHEVLSTGNRHEAVRSRKSRWPMETGPNSASRRT